MNHKSKNSQDRALLNGNKKKHSVRLEKGIVCLLQVVNIEDSWNISDRKRQGIRLSRFSMSICISAYLQSRYYQVTEDLLQSNNLRKSSIWELWMERSDTIQVRLRNIQPSMIHRVTGLRFNNTRVVVSLMRSNQYLSHFIVCMKYEGSRVDNYACLFLRKLE